MAAFSPGSQTGLTIVSYGNLESVAQAIVDQARNTLVILDYQYSWLAPSRQTDSDCVEQTYIVFCGN